MCGSIFVAFLVVGSSVYGEDMYIHRYARPHFLPI